MRLQSAKHRPLAAMVSLAVALLALWSLGAEAHPRGHAHRSLVGSWEVTIQPEGGATVPGLVTYHADGVLISSGTPPPGLSVSSGHGVWKRVGHRTFVLTFKLFQLRADRSIDSTLKVTERLVLNRSFTAYEGEATLELFFPGGGSFVIPGVFATQGTRIRVEE